MRKINGEVKKFVQKKKKERNLFKATQLKWQS